MTTPEQIAYIRQQLAGGVSRGDIVKSLLSSGWKPTDIDEAFASLVPQTTAPSTAAPQVTEQQPYVMTETFPSQRTDSSVAHGSHAVLWIAVAAVVLTLLAGGTAFAYLQKIGPFSQTPYSEDNLISGLLMSSAKITSSSYSFSADLTAGPRDEGAVPFTIRGANDPKLIEQYKNDATRASNITSLLGILRYPLNNKYPATLQEVVAAAAARSSFYSKDKFTLTDPLSKGGYRYVVNKDGTDFTLTATFETQAAISAIRKSYRFATSTTLINGRTVSFTKDSTQYIYLSSEPPKPFLVHTAEMMRYLPPEISATLTVGATSDWGKIMADWKSQVSATGDFGDMSIKFDIEALKKDKDYYFRVNKIPSLLDAYISSIKGQWVKVDPKAIASSTPNSPYVNQFQKIAQNIPKDEAEYKKNRAQAADEIKRLAAFADEVHLLSFKNAPRSEKVGEKMLYRYDVQINKESILEFYKKVVEDANANPQIKSLGLFDDPGMVDYLQSDEFSQTVDYMNENTTITLWVDAKGFLSALEYKMRIVPPDTATQLAKKQINITFRLELSDINQPVDIVAPAESKPIQELIDEVSKSTGDARTKGSDATIRSDLSMIRTQAEIYYDSNNSYGTQSLVAGAVASCKTGMFKDATITRALSSADTANGAGKNIACYANGKSYVAGADLASDGWWCVDSTGASKKETGSISAAALQSKKCP